MSYTAKRFLILSGLFLSGFFHGLVGDAGTAFAEPLEQELQNWDVVTLRVDGPKRLRFYAEVQPRVGLEGNPPQGAAIERVILRPAVGYQVTKSMSVWQGYAYIPSFRPDFNVENRIFQQLQFENKIRKLTVVNRSRLEERFIEGAGDTAVRARHLLRLQYPITKSGKWSVVGHNELFVNLNDTKAGPQSGFDQNRVFAGVNRKFNDHVNAEAGYMMNYLDRKNSPDKINHVILLTVNMIVK